MTLVHRLASMLSWILRRNRAEQRLDDEVRAFVEMATADKMREGVPAAEARRLALVELGGIEPVKESVRAGRHGALLDDVGRDVRYAFRLCARQRTFALVIVGTLASAFDTAMKMLADRPLPATSPTMKKKRRPSRRKKS